MEKEEGRIIFEWEGIYLEGQLTPTFLTQAATRNKVSFQATLLTQSRLQGSNLDPTSSSASSPRVFGGCFPASGILSAIQSYYARIHPL